MAKIVLSGDASREYTLLPEGTYDFEVDAVEQRTAKNSGNPQLKVDVHVIDGPTTVGRKTVVFLSLVDKAMWNVKAFLDATGVDYDSKEVPTQTGKTLTVGFDPDELPGTRFRAKVSHRMWEGKARENISDFVVSPLDMAIEEEAPVAAPVVQQAPVQAAPATDSAAAGNLRRRRAQTSAAS